eukprot:3258944-Rhodomonas_salina.1
MRARERERGAGGGCEEACARGGGGRCLRSHPHGPAPRCRHPAPHTLSNPQPAPASQPLTRLSASQPLTR